MIITSKDIAVSLAVIAGMLLLMWSVRKVGRHLDWPAEVQRKTVHVTTGCVALFFPILFSGPFPVFVLTGCAVVVMLVLRQGRLAEIGIGSALHSVQRKSYGEIYLALAVAVLFFRSDEQAVLYVLPLLVITLSDAAAALIGTSYGRRRFAVVDGMKSLEGVVSFFVVTWLCAMIALLLMTDAARLNVIVLAFLIATFCAIVEADSWNGLDNIFVPIGAHIFLASQLDAELSELVVLTASFATALLGMLALAAWIKMTPHAARAYTVLFFLILSVTAPHNALFPIAAIAMHIFARTLRPCRSKRPDLDLLAIATGVALFWLLAGEMLGRTAIDLFNLTFAAAAVLFAALGLSRSWRIVVIPVAIAMAYIFLWVSKMNVTEAIWHTPGWPLIALGLCVPCLAGLARPQWFARFRSFKAFGLAIVVPFGIFVFNGALL